MTPEDWKLVMNSKTKEILEQTIKALENVPEVNGVYDQQHSDTQIAAILKLKEIITNDNGTY
jgi:nitrate reductase NapAB chaperone NapD